MKAPSAKPEILGEVANGLTVTLKTGLTVVVTGRHERICWVREVIDGREAPAPRPMSPGEPLAAEGGR